MVTSQIKPQEKNWVKRNIPLITLRKGDPKGVEELEGVFIKRGDTTEVKDSETGEIKERNSLIFHKIGSATDKFQIWENAGLKNAMLMADVQPGNTVRIVHLGLEPRGQGKKGTFNNYDIFTLN